MEHRSLTEGLPLLFGIPFIIVIFLAMLFSLCGHFLIINTWMDGWITVTYDCRISRLESVDMRRVGSGACSRKFCMAVVSSAAPMNIMYCACIAQLIKLDTCITAWSLHCDVSKQDCMAYPSCLCNNLVECQPISVILAQ